MFIGFINFYRAFIKGFGGIVKPLYELTGEGNSFVQIEKEQQAFNILKEAISKELILRIPNFNRPFYIEIDVSDFVIRAELYQKFGDGRYLIGFFLKKISRPVLNYPVYNKELIAIIKTFDKQRPYLNGIEELVNVYTDYRNL